MEHESRIHLRGFGSMDPTRRAEMAAKGGRKAHQLGTAHVWTQATAAAAGRKGAATRARRRQQTDAA